MSILNFYLESFGSEHSCHNKENYIEEYARKHKGVFERSFSKKDLGEAAYIVSIKIYRDRSRRLISFFNEY